MTDVIHNEVSKECCTTTLRTVLVVEDEEYCASTLEIALLRIPGVDVRLASSVAEACEVLESGGEVACVVTDLRLPGADGFDLIRRIRDNWRIAEIPIVVVSGETDDGTGDRLHSLKVNACFGKPYSAASLCREVAHLLETHAQSVPAGLC